MNHEMDSPFRFVTSNVNHGMDSFQIKGIFFILKKKKKRTQCLFQGLSVTFYACKIKWCLEKLGEKKGNNKIKQKRKLSNHSWSSL